MSGGEYLEENFATILFQFEGVTVTTSFVTVFTLILGTSTILVTLYNRFRDIRYRKFDYTTKVLEMYVNDIIPAMDNLESKVSDFKNSKAFKELPTDDQRQQALTAYEQQCGINSIFNKIELTSNYINRRNVVFRSLIENSVKNMVFKFLMVHEATLDVEDGTNQYRQTSKLIKRWTHGERADRDERA